MQLTPFSIRSSVKSSRIKFLSLLLCLFIGSLCLVAPAYADLPPRPTPVAPQVKDKPSRPAVAPIILNTNPAPSGLWSVVQWQDAQDGWQDVPSWRGAVVNGRTIWWVEQKDFGKGPFRWAVLQGESGALVATSQPFTLPTQPQKLLVVAVTLP